MSLTSRVLLVLFALGLATCGGGGGDGNEPGPVEPFVMRDIAPGAGLRVFQVSFLNPQVSHLATSWGMLLIAPDQLRQTMGIADGWINVATERGWVIRNRPLDGSQGTYVIYFDLGLAQPQALQQISLHVKHSNRGVGGIQQHLETATRWPIEIWEMDARGISPLDIDPGPPPMAATIDWEARAALVTNGWFQGYTNEQCAFMQCMTMATANALQYLEDRSVWTVPHDHDMGLGGDDTLVGQLDTACGRSCPARDSGGGVRCDDLVDGTFGYLHDNGLAGLLSHRHQDSGTWSTLPASDYSTSGSTSQYDGNMPTYEWIWDRISEGCGVIAVFSYDGGGGHAVRVTAVIEDDAGTQLLRYAHDGRQTNSDATDTAGLVTVEIEIDDTDGDGVLNFGARNRELRFVWAHCRP